MMRNKLYPLLSIFLIAGSLLYVTKAYIFSQTCLTREQVETDSRCLYIFNNQVFEKGTRQSPHKGHACGGDLTQLVPESHRSNPALYLDPHYKGGLCADAPTATPPPTGQPTPIRVRIGPQVRSPTIITRIRISSEPTNPPTGGPAETPAPEMPSVTILPKNDDTLRALGSLTLIASYILFAAAIITTLLIIVLKLKGIVKK